MGYITVSIATDQMSSVDLSLGFGDDAAVTQEDVDALVSWVEGTLNQYLTDQEDNDASDD